MKSFGEKLRELRDSRDLSLRKLAGDLGVTAPFLSDIELGRRLPSEKVLSDMAVYFGIPLKDLKMHDYREPLSEMKKMAELEATWGMAFRTIVDKAKRENLSPEDLINKLKT